MDSTTVTIGLPEPAPSLDSVMSDFATGALSLQNICDIFCRELDEDRNRGADIQALLDQELKARRLPVSDYKELVEGINAWLRGERVSLSEKSLSSENLSTARAVPARASESSDEATSKISALQQAEFVDDNLVVESLPEAEQSDVEAMSMDAFSDGDTALLEEIAETTRREALNETHELSALAGAPEHMHIDTTSMESLNETTELQSLAGADELKNTVFAADAESMLTSISQMSELESEMESGDTSRVDELNETGHLHSLAVSAEPTGPSSLDPTMNGPQPRSVAHANSMHIDTAKLEAMPDFGFADDVQSAAAQVENQPVSPGQEIPYVDTISIGDAAATPMAQEVSFADTVNLDAAAVSGQANILDSKAAGFFSGADPAASVSVPVEEPPHRHRPSKVKSKESSTPSAHSRTSLNLRQREKVTAQLSGGGQRQVREGSSFMDMLKKPPVAASMLIMVVGSILFGVGMMLSIFQPKQVGQLQAQQAAGVSQKVITPASANEPIVVDLSASTKSGSSTPSQAQTADLFVAEPARAKPVVAAKVGADGFVFAPPVVDPLAAQTKTTAVNTTSASAADSVREIPFAEPESLKDRLKVDSAQQQLLLELRAKAEQTLKRDRLLEPEGDNAEYWIKTLRVSGAEPSTLKALQSELAGKLVVRAERAYIQGDIQAAVKWADEAERLGATQLELAPIRASIRNYSLAQ